MIRLKYIFIIWLLSFEAYATNTLSYHDLDLNIDGYVGYKYINSSAKNSAIHSEPELGLLLSLDINDNWGMFTQFEYDTTIERSLAYSFVSYRNQLTDNIEVNINGGQLRHDYGLYNNTRLNPKTRQGVIVPQAIYWDSLKHLVVSGTGINFKLKYDNLEVGYTIDNPDIIDPVKESKIWSSSLLNKINTTFGSHHLATLKYSFDTIPLVYKSSWTWLNLGNDTTPIAAIVFPKYAGNDYVSQIWNNGFIYNHDKWILSAEASLVKPYFGEWFNSDENSIGVSFTAEYELTDHLSLRTNYNKFKSLPVKNPSQPWYRRAEDANIGLNYHQDNWMIGMEYHHINGGRTVFPDDWNQDPDSYREWHMIGINAAYFF
jgi:hypothetical protein